MKNMTKAFFLQCVCGGGSWLATVFVDANPDNLHAYHLHAYHHHHMHVEDMGCIQLMPDLTSNNCAAFALSSESAVQAFIVHTLHTAQMNLSLIRSSSH